MVYAQKEKYTPGLLDSSYLPNSEKDFEDKLHIKWLEKTFQKLRLFLT